MKKSLLILGVGLIGLALPIAGMTITPTRNLILGLAPDEAILALADKIDEEAGKNDEQTQKINEQGQLLENLNTAEQQRKEELDSLTKNQLIASCKEKQSGCESRISAIETQVIILSNGTSKTGDRKNLIKDIESNIKDCKKTRDSGEFTSEAIKNAWERCIKNGEKDIEIIEKVIKSETAEKNELLNGECKDYKNPCE